MLRKKGNFREGERRKKKKNSHRKESPSSFAKIKINQEQSCKKKSVSIQRVERGEIHKTLADG